MKTKNCPKCGFTVSDEFRFCLECGAELSTGTDFDPPPTIVFPEPTQLSPSVPNVGGDSQEPQSTIIFQGPAQRPPSVLPPARPHSKLPWFVVGICVLVIGVLCYLTIFRGKASQSDNSISQLQSATPFPSATPSPAETSSPAATPSSTPTRSPTASPSPTATSSPAPPSTPSPATTSSPAPSPSTQTVPTQTPPTAEPTIPPVETPASGPGMDQPVAILSKPTPNYTAEARKKRVEGTVVLRVVLRADGSIGTVSVVSGLPNGLSERAIAAARSIKFEPAQKNGVAVSTVVQLEYNFRLY